jgi:hypothetical protein
MVVAAAILVCCAWPPVCVTSTYFISHSAAVQAKDEAVAKGYVVHGGLAEIVSEPGPLGGGDVLVSFTDRTKTPKQRAKMLMRRSWALGGWRVIEWNVEDQPEP